MGNRGHALDAHASVGYGGRALTVLTEAEPAAGQGGGLKRGHSMMGSAAKKGRKVAARPPRRGYRAPR
jgi:hypothetical protein